ncbi:basic leucine zipper 34 [Phoenix dactylifera]|uniref:Basic leucine zipper 34 n=1 Tax=Phoenix dactylifera TaxID=42345 RepID=A0A8B7CNR5_PHODC|nr:basic leucine zipper 34 [Phoenix dactylifera]
MGAKRWNGAKTCNLVITFMLVACIGSFIPGVRIPDGNRNVFVERAFPIRSSSATREPDILASSDIEKLSKEDSSLKGSTKQREGSWIKLTQSEMEAKRAKSSFAQRSRVRKLQYNTELERHIQALQIEGMGVSAELEFLDQQKFILSLENKALKQHLDGLSQEHLVKCLQQEMLEREIARLRALHHHQQQHQQQPPAPPTHSQSNSRDLEIQFANLFLKHKESNSGREPITGLLHI